MNPEKWALMDDAIDNVLKKVRSGQQNGAEISASLESLIAVINSLDNQSDIRLQRIRHWRVL
jgi:hypothetical protein